MIAAVVPDRIVHDLEAVQIDEQDAELLIGARRVLDMVSQAVAQQCPIRQAGQCVVKRGMLDLPFLLLSVGDVVQHPDRRVAAVLFVRAHGDAGPEAGSIRASADHIAIVDAPRHDRSRRRP